MSCLIPQNGSALLTSALPELEVLIGSTTAMAQLYSRLQKLRQTEIPVLITGENGTGKGLLARLLHSCSPAQSGDFEQINCAALPANLVESELFGYEKGAFTGASSSRKGRVEMAGKGTVFLDEIAELGVDIQAKLLHLLQDGTFCRLGSHEPRSAKARFVFATNRDLEEAMLEGSFREDLYYRIEGLTLHLPPLRERVEDLPGLVSHFVARYNAVYRANADMPSGELLGRLQEYHWPGNIRELENVIRRYVVLGSEELIVSEFGHREREVFQFVIPPNGKLSLKEISRQAVRQVERQVMLKALESNGWKRKRTARMLQISYRALIYKLEEAGICCRNYQQCGVLGTCISASQEHRKVA